MNRFRVSQRFAQRCGVPRFATTTAASDADRAQSGVLQAVSRLGAVAGTVMLGGAIITIKWRSDQKKVDREWRQRNGLPIDGVAPSLNEIPAEAQAAVDAIAEAFRAHATNANEQPKEAPPVSEAHAAVAKIFEAAKQAPRTKEPRDGHHSATEPLARRVEEPSSIIHSTVAHDTTEKHADPVATATAPQEEHAPVASQMEAKAMAETADTSTASVEVVEAVVVAVAGASDTTIVVVEAEKGNSGAASVVVVEDAPQLNLVFEIVSTPSNEASNAAVPSAEGAATADDIVTPDAPAEPASSEESSLAAIVAVMEEGVAPLVVMTTDESKDSTVVIVIEDAAATPAEQQLPVEPSAVVTPPSTNADATSAPSETHSHQ